MWQQIVSRAPFGGTRRGGNNVAGKASHSWQFATTRNMSIIHEHPGFTDYRVLSIRTVRLVTLPPFCVEFWRMGLCSYEGLLYTTDKREPADRFMEFQNDTVASISCLSCSTYPDTIGFSR